jgi:hypothetical protein
MVRPCKLESRPEADIGSEPPTDSQVVPPRKSAEREGVVQRQPRGHASPQGHGQPPGTPLPPVRHQTTRPSGRSRPWSTSTQPLCRWTVAARGLQGVTPCRSSVGRPSSPTLCRIHSHRRRSISGECHPQRKAICDQGAWTCRPISNLKSKSHSRRSGIPGLQSVPRWLVSFAST